jgi:myosin heavy subunit
MNDLYTPLMQAHYATSLIWTAGPSFHSDVPPHVYKTSSLAYRGLACHGQNQSILVSWESGARKTETVKILMSHLAAVQTGGCSDFLTSDQSHNVIIKRVLESNPILEAFGNAKAARNDNSSWFGKYIQLEFHAEDPHTAALRGKAIPSAILAGSKCVTYLLEKNRVVLHESARERGYHIFYQLLAGPKEYKRTDIFRSVQAEYEFEGIELDEVKFEDNTAVLQVFSPSVATQWHKDQPVSQQYGSSSISAKLFSFFWWGRRFYSNELS